MGQLTLTEAFMMHFQELRNETNDSPQTLVNFFQEKPEFRNLAQTVRRIAEKIDNVGNYRKIHPQISTQFIQDWKKFQYKWKKEIFYLDYIDACESLQSIGLSGEDTKPEAFEDWLLRDATMDRHAPDPDWEENFDPSQHDGAAAFSAMMEMAAHELETNRSMDEDQVNYRMANTWDIGITAVNYLEKTIGISVKDAFGRWNKIPPVFVPQHVSDRHGITEKGSLYELLNDAIRAYVAGAPAASVAGRAS